MAAVAAAVAACEVEFRGEDHEAVVVVIEVGAFNQFSHGIDWWGGRWRF